MRPSEELGQDWIAVKMSPDMNVLLRASVRDDESQALLADRALQSAASVLITLPALCEFVWALRSVYRYKREQVATAVRKLLVIADVDFDEDAVQAGLAVLAGGGDFADGVIAYEGRRLGGYTFVSFDRRAVAILKAQGHAADLIA